MGVATGRFEREDRLLRRRDFGQVARDGQRARVRGFLVMARTREGRQRAGRVRLGITVSRHVGNAVLRNRLKRWIREWFRYNRAAMRPDLDMVVVVRRTAEGVSQHEVTGALEAGARALGLLA